MWHQRYCNRETEFENCTRRRFLQSSTVSAASLPVFSVPQSLQEVPLIPEKRQRSVILIMNVGGLSQLDCFDPKPAAISEIRGPFEAISTASPEFQLSELLPKHAAMANLFSLVRSCTHDAGPVHEVGTQLMLTGQLASPSEQRPAMWDVASRYEQRNSAVPGHVFLQGRAISGKFTGESRVARQALREEKDQVWDLTQETVQVRENYGRSEFGQHCLMARRLIEAGCRFVTINTFPTIYNQPSWDVHGGKPFTTLQEMASQVAPMYDQAFCALLQDLQDRGMLDETLVCCLSEFGRTPRINRQGGRDHWTHCFTSVFAGAGVQGGRVIGKSDAQAAFPEDRPVSPAEVIATVYYSLGIDSQCSFAETADESPLKASVQPIWELF